MVWFVGILAFGLFSTANGLKLRGLSKLDCDGISLTNLTCRENEFVSAMTQNHLFEDTKSFADAALRNSPQQTCENFNGLPDRSKQTLQKFFDENFLVDGDFVKFTPRDVPTSEKIAKKVPFYTSLRRSHQRLVEALMGTWGELGRRMVRGGEDAETKSTLLDLPYPFVVPGGRFRETYYWDSYWTMEGLLASGMNDTARHMLYNFMEVSRKYKFIPNGMRLYYTDRTQPPVVSEMVRIYFEKTGDVRTLVDALPMLLDEYKHFMEADCECCGCAAIAKSKHIKVDDVPTSIITEGYMVRVGFTENRMEDFTLNRYYQTNTQPRVESFDLDVATRAKAAPENRDQLMSEIRAAAESGWDFSSRWMKSENKTGEPSYDLTQTETMNILPVDLNSLLYRLEVNLANFVIYSFALPELERLEFHDYYMDRAVRRAAAMRALMWNPKTDMWHDYNIRTKSRSDHVVHAASFFPIWAGLHQTTEDWARAHHTTVEEEELSALEALFDRGGLTHDCGLAATNVRTGQQWDFPNVWPNLVHIAVEAAVGPSFLRNWPTPTRRVVEHTKLMNDLCLEANSTIPAEVNQNNSTAAAEGKTTAEAKKNESTAPTWWIRTNSTAFLYGIECNYTAPYPYPLSATWAYRTAEDNHTAYWLKGPAVPHDERIDFDPSSKRGRMATNTVRSYVDTAVQYYKKHKTFAEKFQAVADAEGHCGAGGIGGEYGVVEGFGWTNGVLLNFLSNFASHV